MTCKHKYIFNVQDIMEWHILSCLNLNLFLICICYYILVNFNYIIEEKEKKNFSYLVKIHRQKRC